MIEELWNILESLDEKPDDWGEPYFKKDRYYDPVPLSKENFHGLEPKKDDKTICFIDGGNNKIFESPTDSIHLVRIYFNLFKGGKRVKNIDPLNIYLRSEYSDEGVQVKLDPLNDPIPVDNNEFLLKEEELESGSPADCGHTVRKYLEWKTMEYVIDNHLEKGGIVVRDGVFQTSVEKERQFAERAYERAEKKGVFLAGVAKTCSLRTTTGYSLIAAIKELAREQELNRWFYHPVVDNEHPDHKGEVYFVKYHPSSNYVFRTEFYRGQDAPIEDILGHLAFQAQDPIFLGYPYGLVDADKKARVTDEEIKYLKNMSGDKMTKTFRDKINAMNAHDRLSNI